MIDRLQQIRDWWLGPVQWAEAPHNPTADIEWLVQEVDRLRDRLEQLEAEHQVKLLALHQANNKLQAITLMVQGFAGEVKRTREYNSRPKGGMQVPFHGQFACAPPGVMAGLTWHARELLNALGMTWEDVP